jgi:hypothetical protein
VRRGVGGRDGRQQESKVQVRSGVVRVCNEERLEGDAGQSEITGRSRFRYNRLKLSGGQGVEWQGGPRLQRAQRFTDCKRGTAASENIGRQPRAIQGLKRVFGRRNQRGIGRGLASRKAK